MSAPELTSVLVGVTAVLAVALAFTVGRRRRPPPHRWDRHIALQIPLLAPERHCACGRCDQLAAPGAWLADWHYEVPGVLPPTEAPDAIPIRGIAWSYGPKGWDPAIVYVVGHARPENPRPAKPPPAAPSTNGQTAKLPSR